MNWGEILKREGITHFHGTNKKGVAQLIMKEGIKPTIGFKGYKKGDRIYVAKHPPVPSEVEHESQLEFERMSELDGAYAWAATEPPLGYSGWYGEHEVEDEWAKVVGLERKKKVWEWEEGGLWGIKGKDIEWLEVYSVCYRMNVPHYVTKETISPDKLVWMPIEDWEKWFENHKPEIWADCENEIHRGKKLDEMGLKEAKDRMNWGVLSR